MLLKNTLTFLVICCITAPSAATARMMPFDGERKGEIAAVGIGFGMTSIRSQNMGLEGDIAKGTVVIDIRFGYAPDNRLQLFYKHKSSVYLSKLGEHLECYFRKVNLKTKKGVAHLVFSPFAVPVIALITDQLLSGGLGARYYFEPKAPSWFLEAGIGVSYCADPYERDLHNPFPETYEVSPSLIAGVGYEFSRHIDAEIEFGWAWAPTTGNGFKNRWDALSASFSINLMGY